MIATGQLLAIAAGGAVGAVARFVFSTSVYRLFGQSFPYGTLAVNVVGSLAMGLLYVLLLERSMAGAELRAALTIGLLGAFTTFSTFSLETLVLIEQGEIGKAALNVGLSVVSCIGAAWLGVMMGRQL